MKITGFLVLALPIAIGSGVVQAATLAQIRERGYIVVGVASGPSAYGAMTDGMASGFDGALIDDFARSLPFALRREAVPNDEFGEALSRGQIDMVASAFEIAPQQQNVFAFSPPIAEATRYFIRRKSDDGIRTIGDLSGRRFGLLSGAGAIAAMNEFEYKLAKAGGKLGAPSQYPTYADAFKALASGEIDFVIGDVADLEEAVKDRPEEFALGEPVSRKIYVGWATPKGDAEIAGLVSNFLAQERKSGALEALQERFLGRRFPDLPDMAVAQDWWTAREDKPTEFPIPLRKDPD